MAQVTVCFSMDEELKQNMESVCRKMGFSMEDAFTLFATKVYREKRIPLAVSADPFYSESNMAYLHSVVSQINSGNATLAEHDLMEN